MLSPYETLVLWAVSSGFLVVRSPSLTCLLKRNLLCSSLRLGQFPEALPRVGSQSLPCCTQPVAGHQNNEDCEKRPMDAIAFSRYCCGKGDRPYFTYPSTF